MPSSNNGYKLYRCPFCGHEVLAKEQPEPLHWGDGHTCTLREVKEE